MNSKHLLLISYVFPPYPGIGGRRWAKMAKYLAREGYTIHVLTAENPFQEQSLWTDDVKQERIIIYNLPASYPDVLLRKNLNLWDKLAYRYWVRVLTKRHPGSIYDRAVAWQPVLHNKAIELIHRFNIRNVIATGAPFRALYFATELKNEIEGLNVIADLRDPWTAGKSYGFEGMTQESRAVEVAMERAVVEHADVITAPAVEILADLNKRYGFAEKMVHLPHAFDPEDYSGQRTEPLFPEDTISFAFTGTIYAGLEKCLQEIAAMLIALKMERPHIYKRLRIDFYTADEKHANLFTGVAEAVRFKSPLPPRLLFATLSHYRYALVLFTEQYKDFLSTKFWELFHLRLPVIYLGPQGRVSDFLQTHGVGLPFTGKNAVIQLKELIIGEQDVKFHFGIDTTEFSCKSIVKKLEALLQ